MRDVNGKELRGGQKVRILAPGQFSETEEGTVKVGELGIVNYVDSDDEYGVDVDHIGGTFKGFDYFRPQDVEIIEG